MQTGSQTFGVEDQDFTFTTPPHCYHATKQKASCNSIGMCLFLCLTSRLLLVSRRTSWGRTSHGLQSRSVKVSSPKNKRLKTNALGCLSQQCVACLNSSRILFWFSCFDFLLLMLMLMSNCCCVLVLEPADCLCTGGVLARAQSLFCLAWFHAVCQERRNYIPQVGGAPTWTEWMERLLVL